MKHAIRVCYSFWQRFWPRLAVLGIGVIALILILPEQPSGIRLTEAFRLQTDTQDYQLPESVIDADRLKGTWQPVTLPCASAPQWYREKQSPSTTQLTWYRLQVPASHQLALPLYLFIPYGKSNGTLSIYADRGLAYQSHANLQWNGSNQPRWIALPNTTQSRVPHELLIRVQHEKASGEGLSSVWIGTHDELYARYAKLNFLQTQLSGVGSAAFLATGLFAFLIWLTRRSEPIYALFFLMSVFYFAASMNSYVGDNQLLLSDAWFGWLTVNSTLWMLCTFHLFLEQLHGCRRKGLTRTLLISSAGMSLITVPDIAGLTNSTAINLLLYLFIVIMGIGVFALGLWNSVRRPSRDGILLSGWGMLIALSGFADWLMQSSFIGMENVFLTKYASIGLVFVFWYIMFRRYVDALRTVEAAKNNLAQRLKEREAELAAAHERLREIERRQTLSQERQRLMQDMHDGLGSSLVSALRVVEHGRMDEAEVAQVLKGCIDDLKLAIDSMEPVDADLLLLLATLRYRLGSRLESSGIALRWEVKSVPKLDWLDPKNALHILRILQEAFTNIIKHTHATEIRVATRAESDHVVVTITDNGQGFAVENALKSGGKGLSNQMRRAEFIGAEIKWDSDDAGTRFTLRLPIKRISGTTG
jgi:signal transduction histidine kinase